MSTTPDGEWPAETRPLPPAPPLREAGPPLPPPAEPANRIGLGMLLAIGLLAVFAAVLAAILITRHHHRAAASTVVVTTTSAPAPARTTTTKAKKLILPVPDLVGRPWQDAAAGLRRSGFHVSFVTVRSALPRGAVTAQDPAPGAKVAKGSDVRLNVSSGVKQQPATGTSQATTPAATPGTATTTPAGQGATTGTSPTTTEAAQPTSGQVPSLAGELRPALAQLDQSGFLASIAYVPGTDPLGTVVAQSPAGGATAKTHSQVTVNVSSGPSGSADQSVPDVVGQRIPQALGALNGAGLRLILLRMRVTDRAQAGVVVAQTPQAGKKAPKNAQVLVYMGAYQQ